MARVTATLRGAAADPGRQDDLHHGTLREELHAPGFEVFTGGLPTAESVERFEKPIKRVQRDESAEERRERERRERAQETLRVGESEIADWRRRAHELDATLTARRKAVEEARKVVEELREQLGAAQERLMQEERSAEQAEREAERARREAEKAEARLKAAEKAMRATARSTPPSGPVRPSTALRHDGEC
jgi:DNA repair exonuclease SbcCD ATPase subunit